MYQRKTLHYENQLYVNPISCQSCTYNFSLSPQRNVTVFTLLFLVDLRLVESNEVYTEILKGTTMSIVSPSYPDAMSPEKQEINCTFNR